VPLLLKLATKAALVAAIVQSPEISTTVELCVAAGASVEPAKGDAGRLQTALNIRSPALTLMETLNALADADCLTVFEDTRRSMPSFAKDAGPP
jgi:hypothetical protein